MVSPRFRSEELTIQHVREPGQGMPISGCRTGEGPGEVFPTQPPLHVAVSADIIGVIELQKTVLERGKEGPEHEHKKNNSGEKQLPPGPNMVRGLGCGEARTVLGCGPEFQ